MLSVLNNYFQSQMKNPPLFFFSLVFTGWNEILQSNQHNHSRLKAGNSSTLLRGATYPLSCKPNWQVNRNRALQCADGMKYSFRSAHLCCNPHIWSLHIHNMPSQIPWVRWDPGRQYGRLKPALKLEKRRECVQETIYQQFWSLTTKTRITTGFFTYN